MAASDLVPLKGGFAVPADVLRRLWTLEDRGLRFTRDDPYLVVSPPELLTPDDRAFIKTNKTLILEVLTYCQDVEAPC